MYQVWYCLLHKSVGQGCVNSENYEKHLLIVLSIRATYPVYSGVYRRTLKKCGHTSQSGDGEGSAFYGPTQGFHGTTPCAPAASCRGGRRHAELDPPVRQNKAFHLSPCTPNRQTGTAAQLPLLIESRAEGWAGLYRPSPSTRMVEHRNSHRYDYKQAKVQDTIRQTVDTMTNDPSIYSSHRLGKILGTKT